MSAQKKSARNTQKRVKNSKVVKLTVLTAAAEASYRAKYKCDSCGQAGYKLELSSVVQIFVDEMRNSSLL